MDPILSLLRYLVECLEPDWKKWTFLHLKTVTHILICSGLIYVPLNLLNIRK